MNITEMISELYDLNGYEMLKGQEHEGGRNLVYICSYEKEPRYAVRISVTGDRLEQDYLAEAEFV